MGGEAVVRRELRLSLQEFGWRSMEARAEALDAPVSVLLRQAVLHYLVLRASEKAAVKVPRFAREEDPARHSVDVRLELEEAEWSLLEVEAVHQRVSIERLIEHAAMQFLADLESGRAAIRVVEEGEEEEGKGPSRS